MTKNEVKELVAEYIRRKLEIKISVEHKAGMLAGEREVCVILSLDGEIIDVSKDTF